MKSISTYNDYIFKYLEFYTVLEVSWGKWQHKLLLFERESLFFFSCWRHYIVSNTFKRFKVLIKHRRFNRLNSLGLFNNWHFFVQVIFIRITLGVLVEYILYIRIRLPPYTSTIIIIHLKFNTTLTRRIVPIYQPLECILLI